MCVHSGLAGLRHGAGDTSLRTCSHGSGACIQRFSFVNGCAHDIMLGDWNVVVPASSSAIIAGLRSDNLQRISWRYSEKAASWDFIELNSNWRGSGTRLAGHPSYSSYAGFSTSSRYEGLIPGSSDLCGPAAGAEVRFDADDAIAQGICKPTYSSASCESSNLASCFACQGYDGICPHQDVGESEPICLHGKAGDFCRYIYANSYAISWDSTTRTRSAARTFQGTDTYANYWCASTSGLPGVGSLFTCVDQGQDIELRLTACIS